MENKISIKQIIKLTIFSIIFLSLYTLSILMLKQVDFIKTIPHGKNLPERFAHGFAVTGVWLLPIILLIFFLIYASPIFFKKNELAQWKDDETRKIEIRYKIKKREARIKRLKLRLK